MTSGWTEEATGRRAAGMALAVAVVVLLAAFVYYLVGPISLPWQRAEAHMSLSAETAGDVVHVNGTTDLPDGARLGYALVPQAEADNIKTLPAHQLGGDAKVAAGAFRFDVDLAGWPRGTVILTVSFAVGAEDPQPSEVVRRFGSEGEHLAGPQVFAKSPGGRKEVYVTTKVHLGE